VEAVGVESHWAGVVGLVVFYTMRCIISPEDYLIVWSSVQVEPKK
jgi:hypothetical protein